MARLPFSDQLPTEQYIIGQGDKGIRFYNFADPMDTDRLKDCKQFVDTYTQYLGDRTYDFITDVVITDFAEEFRKDGTVGFVKPSLEGVLFIDAKLLKPHEQANPGRLDDHSKFLVTLVHEGGHLLHGHDEQADEQQIEFSKKVGWDIDALQRDNPYWRIDSDVNLEPYAPVYEPVITLPDGTKRRMTWDEADAHGVQDYDEDGNYSGPDFYVAGAPSTYGEKNPSETSAETTAHMMLGDLAIRMPETSDAWLEHVQQRVLKPGEQPADRPIATPIKRTSIIAEHRTGNEILYPRTELPAAIHVQLHPVS